VANSRGEELKVVSQGFIDPQPIDPISPVSIVHKVDDIIIDGVLEQSYNFLTYTFEGDGVRIEARTYLDAIHKATLYPPIAWPVGLGGIEFIEAPDLREAVIGYLRRRFRVIEGFGLSGPETITA
jgi:hypothetical protein